MATTKAKKWVIAQHFQGKPKDSDLRLEEEDLPEVQDGEIQVEALYWSVDPYMRPYSARLPVGSQMIGQQLARIVKSKNQFFKEGALVLAAVGWRDKTVVNFKKMPPDSVYNAWKTGDLPPSLALGVLGMPGLTAYFGFLKICEPKEGETVFVNSAAGIVGSLVGQIAKIKGCRVIGCAGTDDKCKWLKDELGFDYVFNYKTAKLSEALKEGAPKGIDCYFDNVGGEMTTTVLTDFMNKYGRISNCGVLSVYNATTRPTGPEVYWVFVQKELKMQGFIISSFKDDWVNGIMDLQKWLNEGKIKWKEVVLDGIENIPSALYGLLDGKYTGKVVIKAKV